jgi:predicted Zn-dependent protease
MTSQTGLDDELYAMFHRAIEIAAGGQWSQAAEILLSVHAAAPESALVMVQAAHVLLKLDRYREAHSIALRLAERSIEPVELLSRAIRLVRRFEEPQALAALIANSQCWRTSRSGPLLGEIALHLGSAGLFEQATELLDRACTMNPAYHHVHYLRGAIATFAGRSESARWHLHRSLELEPNQGHVHWMLSMQNDSVASDEEIAGLVAASRPPREWRCLVPKTRHTLRTPCTTDSIRAAAMKRLGLRSKWGMRSSTRAFTTIAHSTIAYSMRSWAWTCRPPWQVDLCQPVQA